MCCQALFAAAQVPIVEQHADFFAGEFAGFELLFDAVAVFADLRAVFVAAVDRQDHHVLGGQPRRADEAVVIAVRHDQGTDEPGRDAPGSRPGERFAAGRVLEFDLLGTRKILAEEVGGARLQGLAVLHHGLDGIGGDRPGKPLAGRFFPLDDGHGHFGFGEVGVDVEHFHRFFAGLGLGGVGRVALLPKKLGRAEEHAGPHLPTDDVGPLVNEDRQIAVRLHPFGVHGADDGFARRPDDQRLFQRCGGPQLSVGTGLQAVVRDDGTLFGKPLDVLGLFFQKAHGNEERKIGVFVPRLFEPAVEAVLHVLPDAPAPGPDHHATANGGKIGQVGRLDHLLVPLGIVFLASGRNCRFGALAMRSVPFLVFAAEL